MNLQVPDRQTSVSDGSHSMCNPIGRLSESSLKHNQNCLPGSNQLS